MLKLKSKKLLLLGLVAAFAVAANLGAASKAFAEDDLAGVTGGTDTHTQAVITKEIDTVRGQSNHLKNQSFEFDFVKRGNNPVDYPAVTISTGNMESAKSKTDGANVKYYFNSADLMAYVTSNKDTKFKNAGVYEWDVTEKAGNTEHMTYSTAKYVFRVIKGTDGSVKSQVIDLSTPSAPKKVNPEPVTPTPVDPGSDSTMNTSEFKFVNNYKTGASVVYDADLTVSKDVDGINTDNPDQAFAFTLKLTAPEGANFDSVEVDHSHATTFDGTNGTYTLSLKKGESVKLSKLPEGTVYSLVETTTGNFSHSAALTSGDESAALPSYTGQATDANKNVQYTLDLTTTKGNTVALGAGATAAVTNKFTVTEFTGVVINNLPFVLMVGVPVACAAGYVVLRRRNA